MAEANCGHMLGGKTGDRVETGLLEHSSLPTSPLALPGDRVVALLACSSARPPQERYSSLQQNSTLRVARELIQATEREWKCLDHLA